jgi:hypothetical protein
MRPFCATPHLTIAWSSRPQNATRPAFLCEKRVRHFRLWFKRNALGCSPSDGTPLRSTTRVEASMARHLPLRCFRAHLESARPVTRVLKRSEAIAASTAHVVFTDITVELRRSLALPPISATHCST